MRITKVSIYNYRNLDNIEVWLNNKNNYIIGENNLGKSNFLHLLTIVCNGKSFAEEDYNDTKSKIEIDFQIKMNDYEIGYFDDNFDETDYHIINLKYSQSISDSYPTLICTDTNDEISIRKIKKLNFYTYESTAIPAKELKFDSSKGLGILVESIIHHYVEDRGEEFFNNKNIENLRSYINERFKKIQGFKLYGLEAAVDDEVSNMLKEIFYLSDGERNVDKAGAGVQYVAMASISVLSYITKLFSSKTQSFDERLSTSDDGRKYLPIILAIDEPEVHLHPYLQRTLIRYYKKILANEDKEFLELLKYCFDIDGLEGQLIIVTHSTDSLIDDYRNIIRFYRNEGITKVVCGSNPNFTISKNDEKQLIMNFQDMKEAFYAHVVILIEGETEYGCIPYFAEKMGISLDEYAICIVNARGEGSIKRLSSLFDAFEIKNISIYDGDVINDETISDTDFFTIEPCFEFEIVKNLCNLGEYDTVKQIVQSLYSHAMTEMIDVEFIRKPYTKKLGLDIDAYEPKTLESIPDNDPEFYYLYSCWMYVKKGVLLGRIIGQTLTETMIPICYVNAIKKAKEVACNDK